MGTLSHVLNTGARPIGAHEFSEAVRAICPPRFPTVRVNMSRRVGLAISGGVDSMALAFLCARLRASDPNFQLADNPISSFLAVVVDHGLREGSRDEATAVSRAVRRIGLSCEVHGFIHGLPGSRAMARAKMLGLHKNLNPNPNPNPNPDQNLNRPSNLESAARQFRYQKLGNVCSHRRIASLLLAHHQDDQYETVLMRLLQGHGVRGLRGIWPAADIPECDGMHGAHRSGYIDDQKEARPFYSSRMPAERYRALGRQLRASIDTFMREQERRDLVRSGLDEYDWSELQRSDEYHECRESRRLVPLELGDVDVEDGGIMVYRPLLEFSKDRLIATCEANDIPWWEDSTNQDRTLTLRNAVRHMYKNYPLPVALQKPSILALARRCERTVRTLEAEANRLLAETIIHAFEPNVGSATVQFPNYSLSRFSRDICCPRRRRARTLRQREVAGILINRIIALVSPEEHTVSLQSLQNAMSSLFPALSMNPAPQDTDAPGHPKAFVVAGVHFIPIEPSPGSLSWYLSRTPYPAHLPIPRFCSSYWSPPENFPSAGPARKQWSRWLGFASWDGRFWVRLRHCLPYRVVVQPFLQAHAKAFRDRLSPEDRDRLTVLLKHYAPGKTRWTLPALYLEEELDLRQANPRPRPHYPVPPAAVREFTAEARLEEYDDDESDDIDEIGESQEEESKREGGGRKRKRLPSRNLTDPDSEHPRVLDDSRMMLVALPSLDVCLPGLEDWLEYEIRYRRTDRVTIRTAGSAFHNRGSAFHHHGSAFAVERSSVKRLRSSLSLPSQRPRRAKIKY
ncbi:adenine nucleotide alpha hydrolases-like protein [Nemania sp. FL0916]|nr:adenine nucleotide alpha hydrolases-like protein [Nemania sp. FL0916]